MRQRDRGSVLVMALFVVFFLAAIALKLSHVMHLEIELTQRHIKRLQSFCLARSGFVLAIEDLKKDMVLNDVDSFNDSWRTTFQGRHRPRVHKLYDTEGELAGTYSISINDERSKMNLNSASSYSLEKLLGALRIRNSRIIAKAVISYKQSRGYDKKFLSIDELLRIEEIDEEMFFGDDSAGEGDITAYGLKDCLTVYADGKVNVNTAPLPVLMSMPGMNRELADILIKAREEAVFAKVDDLNRLAFVNNGMHQEIFSWAAVESNIFNIKASGQVEKANTARQITAIIDRAQEPVKTLSWQEGE
ncbi:MAG: general secretion pathway protein GspK [PVC group bacterium]|nr:general secretion pathway protein GspK [PVC group bacterium]